MSLLPMTAVSPRALRLNGVPCLAYVGWAVSDLGISRMSSGDGRGGAAPETGGLFGGIPDGNMGGER
jgi:hypothetical protein